MTASRNVLSLLLDTNGKPKESFKGISTDDLRLGLVQLIDGLERMDELAYSSHLLAGNWRDGRQESRKQWDKEMLGAEGLLVTTDLEDLGHPGHAFGGCQWVGAERDTLTVSEMGRPDLRKAILESFDVLERFQILAEATAKDATRVMQGLWVQSEGEKAILRTHVHEQAEDAKGKLEQAVEDVAPRRPRMG